MRTMFHAADEQRAVIFENSERDAVVTPARNAPSRHLVAQRFREPVGVCRQSRGDEFGDGGSDFVRQAVECLDGCR